jgi:hypothetical protein
MRRKVKYQVGLSQQKLAYRCLTTCRPAYVLLLCAMVGVQDTSEERDSSSSVLKKAYLKVR